MKTNRQLSVVVMLLFVASQIFAQPQQGAAQAQASTGLVLEDGTPIKLRISRTVSSADAQVGETVDFEVLEEVKLGDVLVIPKGGVALATVTAAESKKRMARGGKLGMNIDSVRLVDGEKAALRAVKDVKGGGHTGAMTGAIVATAIIFWPAAPFFLFMHGKDIAVPKGTEITAYVNGDFKFDAERLQRRTALQAGTANLPQTRVGNPVHSVGDATTLEISSEPLGADVELDGNFVGNTPSTVGVAAGEHTLMVSKGGYGRWQRQIRTSTGSVKVMATLSATPVQAVPEHTVPMSAASLTDSTPFGETDSTPSVESQASARRSDPAVSHKENSSTSAGAAFITRTPANPDGPVSPQSNMAEEACLGVRFAGSTTVRHDGVVVAGVQEGGPAASIDVRPGDSILAIDGHYLYTIDELRAEILRHDPGVRVAIRFQRNKLIFDTFVVLNNIP
jgi:hypothetical protein